MLISTRIIRKRQVKKKSNDIFKSLVKRVDWDLVKENNSANYSYNIFLGLFTKACDQVFLK